MAQNISYALCFSHTLVMMSTVNNTVDWVWGCLAECHVHYTNYRGTPRCNLLLRVHQYCHFLMTYFVLQDMLGSDDY